MSEQSTRQKKRPRAKIKPSASTGTSSGNSALRTVRATQLSAILLRSCKTLNVQKFKECFCNNNLIVLLVKGKPTPDDLTNAWTEIVQEYGSLIKNDNSDYLFSLQKDIADFSIHITQVEYCILLLRHRYSKKAIDELIAMGYHGDYLFDDVEQYHRQLDRITSLVKTKVHDLEILKDEYKRYNNNVDTGAKMSEEDFDMWVSDLGRFQGYRIDQQITMMIEFTGIINAYTREKNAQSKSSTQL